MGGGRSVAANVAILIDEAQEKPVCEFEIVFCQEPSCCLWR
jgi:hypothetical protein